MSAVPILAVRSSSGICVWSNNNGNSESGNYSECQDFDKEVNKSCKAMVFSPNGKYFAWTNSTNVKVCCTSDWKLKVEIPRTKVLDLKFSPKDTYLMTYEIYATNKTNPQGFNNLNVFLVETGELVMSFVQKKQTEWEPEWSGDESIMALMNGGELFIYEIDKCEFGTSWDGKPTKKIGGGRNGRISISPSNTTTTLAFYVPGAQAQPSTCKLFAYPNISQPVASKSFFQADRVDFLWNNRGTNLLLLTATDVDQTGASYYGKQSLQYMSCKGDTAMVQLSKEGSVHAVAWSPKNIEFCVVYGHMPAKATLFNLNCEPVFEFGTGPRNSIYYNQLGNMLILAGFGNLSGRIEVWDAQGRKQLGTTEAPCTTLLEWSPTGLVFVTATTAPRLRMSNGFKIWHYTCVLLHETMWPTGEELLSVCWQTFPRGTFKESVLNNTKVQGIQPSQPIASKQAYRPPSARDRVAPVKFHIEEAPGIPGSGPPSKAAIKLKKKREAKKAKKANEGDGEQPTSRERTVKQNSEVNSKPTTGDAEVDKKIKNIMKKLDAIEKLKQQQSEGKPLEINQIAKIKTEQDLLKELQALKI
ncbi:eukaryotic translation initiation factor 2A-like [Ctenocephalides felis]|uniref:eukaryotic translation initiation factor 2A-like n=1 Tax=Ctenocephalides felis TaxID=7515 RepID=UPI000E6E41D0|nr:eukaryotic translation initiation factor 2A-like [Ctenocephalides felis]